ncbi:MAG: hypothetical protein MJ245_03025 [Clostridia bacterium]|nr:hypothetical protein [Clostridia bacterium]
MIKKLEIVMGAIFIILCIVICISLKFNNKDRIFPSDVVYDYFTLMTEGDFDNAFSTYVDNAKQAQLDVLNGNYDLYKVHWANLGIDIASETYNDNEGTGEVEITVNKFDIEQIISEVRIRLLNVNEIKEDGTTITKEELLELKKQYIKEAYNKAKEKDSNYNIVTNTYTLKLVSDEENDSWKIVDDNALSDILFGNISDSKKNEQASYGMDSQVQDDINDDINNDIV